MPDRTDAAAERPILGDRLADVVAQTRAPLGVAVHADDGWVWEHDAQRVVPAASTVKVLVLLAVLRLVERGRLDLDAAVPLPPASERVGGAGALHLLPSVAEITLVEALRLMVAVSDNDASNAVLDHAGLLAGTGRFRAAGSSSGQDPVGEVLREAGTRHTRLRRRFMDLAAAAAGRDNETSAADLTALVVALRQGRLLDAPTTALAIGLLRDQQSRDGLPAYLPADVLVASKPGDLPGVRTETALLERHGRWAVVSVVADGLARAGSDRGTTVLPVFAAIGELVTTLL